MIWYLIVALSFVYLAMGSVTVGLSYYVWGVTSLNYYLLVVIIWPVALTLALPFAIMVYYKAFYRVVYVERVLRDGDDYSGAYRFNVPRYTNLSAPQAIRTYLEQEKPEGAMLRAVS